MTIIYIENKPYEVSEDRNLLDTCLGLGFDIPYFCWHPAIGSVGACRQCAVKQFSDDNDTHGKIIMSCMTEVRNGLRISINDSEVVRFRRSVIEWLMLNHPHDCPVCDEGGECHLQDMTVMTGHVHRRIHFKKRTYNNQNLGPFVNHEMNRCIQCYRCVRFYRDYAGGRDLNVFSAHDHVYFGCFKDGTLESEFSGNLIEICPTGVFTDKILKQHYIRKWDLQSAPSVCVHCCLGCNTIAGERSGYLRRVLNRFNLNVNGHFLCDRGRFGYQFVNDPNRIRYPLLIKNGADTRKASPDDVKEYFRKAFHFGMRAIGIGSPRASLESNFALRTLVGPDSFYLGMSMNAYNMMSLVRDILTNHPSVIASLEDIRNCDAVLILGEDLTNTAPMADLAVRIASRQKPLKKLDAEGIARWNDLALGYISQGELGPVFIATPVATKLDRIAAGSFRGAPQDIAAFGLAIAHALNNKASHISDFSESEQKLISNIAAALQEAERPLIISGTGCKSEAVITAAASIADSLQMRGCNAMLSYTVPECNSFGLMLIGGGSIEDAITAAGNHADTAVILEQDLYSLAEKSSIDSLMSAIENVIVLDYLPTDSTANAGLVLPAATFAESSGTLVNNESRAQRFYSVFHTTDDVRDSWRWIVDMLLAAGYSEAVTWNSIDEIDKSLAIALPIFKGVTEIAPPADFRIRGMKVPRQPHRYSGRTAMHADISIHEPELYYDAGSPLSFSMEGYGNTPPPSLIPRYWSPGWNSVQASFKFRSETGSHLHGDDSGVRLIGKQDATTSTIKGKAVKRAGHKSGEWMPVPLYHIFGSEKLSMFSAQIAGLAPKPYLALNGVDIKHLKMIEGDMVVVRGKNINLELRLKRNDSLPRGIAGLPIGLPGINWFDFSVRIHIERSGYNTL
ncbi:MAG TPA: NADH-quinone oxidoreductase subunit NuoG [Dissulfurispiraceae bacterium]|nr:NADH-quinone oxidoreductase subunit NuoG [Dissulfurispiraceae bacterium]